MIKTHRLPRKALMHTRIAPLAFLATASLFLGACSDSEASKEEAESEAYSSYGDLWHSDADPCTMDPERFEPLWEGMSDKMRKSYTTAGMSDYEGHLKEKCTEQQEEEQAEIREAEEDRARERELEQERVRLLERAESGRDQQQQQQQQTAPFNAANEAPSPPATSGSTPNWRLMGPFGTLSTCTQNSDTQPLLTSECFSLSDGNAYYWNAVQTP